MSIAQNFSVTSPSLSLDFANVGALDSRVTFARASTATYYGTRTALAEQNLLLQSQTFETTWGLTAATVTANSTTAPDGTTTAETVTPTATSAFHRIVQQRAVEAGLKTFAVYAKANGYNFILLDINDGFSDKFQSFDLSAGTLGSQASGITSSSITSVGNGWYRCILTVNSSATYNNDFRIYVNATDVTVNTSYLADGTSGVFLWGAQLEQRSAPTAYTVTTTQPITNYIPVLETAASGVARFDHNPTTFESLGLLVEQQSTNLFTYSEQFDNAAWTKSATTIEANVVIAPDGTLTGDKLIPNTSVTQHSILQTLAAGTYTQSVYAKAEGYSLLTIAAFDGTGWGLRAIFNLSTGVVASLVNGTAAITNVGNGWYRCSVTGTTTGNAGFRIQVTNTTADATSSFAGNGYSGIYIWGAQLEALAFPTSYIPTVASQVTRAADSASMTGTNFSSWYAQGEGTLYVESLAQNTAASNNKNVRFSDGTTSNEIWLGSSSPGTGARSQITLGGVTYFDSSLPNQVTAGQFGKYAISFETNNAVMCANATLGTVDTAVPISSAINQLTIISPQRAGYYKKIAYYPVAVTSAQLQALTG